MPMLRLTLPPLPCARLSACEACSQMSDRGVWLEHSSQHSQMMAACMLCRDMVAEWPALAWDIRCHNTTMRRHCSNQCQYAMGTWHHQRICSPVCRARRQPYRQASAAARRAAGARRQGTCGRLCAFWRRRPASAVRCPLQPRWAGAAPCHTARLQCLAQRNCLQGQCAKADAEATEAASLYLG